jgi:glutathione synthase
LIRQDPPFDLQYISNTYILDMIKDRVKIINNPGSVRNISEKLYSARYQKFMPDTIFSQNIDQIRKFFKKHKKVIVKPINSYSGNNIHLLTKFNLKFFQKFIKKHDHIMCQKYLPKIKEGDLLD